MRALPFLLQIALATLLLHLALILPNHPGAMTARALLLFPLELPAIVLALVALPRHGMFAKGLRALLVFALVAISVLKLADQAAFTAFSRSFNPVIDMPLVDAALRLLSGSVGSVLALVAVAACIVAIALFAWLLWWATGVWARIEPPRRWRSGAAVAALLAGAFVVAEVGHSARHWRLPFDPPGAAFTARVAVQRAATVSTTLADLRDFSALAAADPYAGLDDLLDRIGGRDVLVIFVESYGRTSFDNDLYAPTHLATLRQAQRRLEGAGLAMRSGWLDSPTAGGQSWLAHGTLASGLRTDNQARYGAMLASPRQTLFHIASQAGFAPLAVMPAITMAWPEAELFGFETVYASDGLGYRGLPFNWVTMPDQYTLSALEHILAEDPGGIPRFVQVALISSHAPWVPIPPVIDWDEVGDGTVFDQWAQSGDPPDVVWRDRDRVRDQYRMAVDYALEVVAQFAQRQAGDSPQQAPLMLIVGDHQPAGFVSQMESRDVPVHIVGPPSLVEAIDGWEWTEGLVPDEALPVWPMEILRDRFLDAFTTSSPRER